MIVRPDAASLTLVTQPDHAALAAEVMAMWLGEGFAGRSTREAALFATAQHDIGWREEDETPSLDPATGGPHDFMTLPDRRRQAIWPRGVSRLSRRSTYAAALVAQHALTVCRHYRIEPLWEQFFATMERERDRRYTAEPLEAEGRVGSLDPGGADRLSFLQDDAVVRLGDLLSLSFCNRWDEPTEQDGYTIRTEGDRVLVAPDPFGGRSVPFSVPARRIPARRHASDAELRDAVTRAEPCLLTGTAVGPSTP